MEAKQSLSVCAASAQSGGSRTLPKPNRPKEIMSWRRKPQRRRKPRAPRPRRPAPRRKVRLPVRQDEDRRQRRDEAAARRQGRQPRRDVPHRPAGAARLHHHHRGLHLLLRPQADLSAGAARRRCRPASPRSRSRRARSSATSKNPLLVSVRSGARDSMPGMMDTILNLGLNDQTVEALAKKTGNARFAWDCYRRFVQMYGDVVLGVQKRAGRGPRAVRDRHRDAQARALSQATSKTPS